MLDITAKIAIMLIMESVPKRRHNVNNGVPKRRRKDEKNGKASEP